MKTLEDSLQDIDASYTGGFIELMQFVMPHEVEFQHGHYGDYDFVATEHDPNDPGGTTRYGLDQANHPHLEIESLTFEQACAEYHTEIWQPLRCDELDAAVALALCDAAINCGTARAVRWLQHIAGTTEDGSIGPETLAAVNALNPQDVANAFDARRLQYYQTEVRPSLQKEYLAGWENRVHDLSEAIA